MKLSSQEVIQRGQISLRSDSRPHPYVLRVMDESDLPAAMRLQSDLIAMLASKDLYVPISEEEMLISLTGTGETIGLFIRDKLYAACSLLFKVANENNMARQLNFHDEELARVAQLEMSLVHPDLRGRRLQYHMAGILAERVQKRPEIRYLFTTVSPFNYQSIDTVTSLGLQISCLCKMYYDWDRYVVYRDFTTPVQLDTAHPVIIANTCFKQQQELLNNGYRGFAVFKDEEGIKIKYARKI